MSNLFAQLQQEATKQESQLRQAKLPDATANDAVRHSDAMASQSDATASDHKQLAVDLQDDHLLQRIVAELSEATVLPNAISIRLNQNEKEFIDDFIHITLRKAGLQGPQVSIAKLMRYSLAYLLLRHQEGFVDALKAVISKKQESNLFK